MNKQTIEYESYMLNDLNMTKYLNFNPNVNPTVFHNIIIKEEINDIVLKEMTAMKVPEEVKEEVIEVKCKSTVKKSSIFFPKEQDSLFWCYYIISSGESSYEMISHKNILVAKQFKIKYVDKIRANKQTIKTYKFDTITNIESNLANDTCINIKTVMALCAIDKINIIFISKKTYYELLMNDTEPIYIIKEIDNNSKYAKKYGFDIADHVAVEEIRRTLYKVDVIDKPIKALSSYKVQDLIDICSKLAIEIKKIDTGKNKTKNEMYESLIQYF
jgi:hypothetical protein